MALDMPKSGNELAEINGIRAQAYVVQDVDTGEVLISKNADSIWTPASLTKLVTALVVLDTNPKLSKVVTMTQADQDLGACKSGGACIFSKSGVKFTVDGLFHAALMPSANNAASALAKSTGMSIDEFALKMNQKARSLGAVNTNFVEPTGMSDNNKITAGDYAKIVAAAFSNNYLRQVSSLPKYSLKSVNNSKYNFASLVEYNGGQKLAIVVLGENHLYTAFGETKKLVSLAEDTRAIALMNFGGMVLGTSTIASAN